MRTIPHSIVSGLLALALTLTAAPAPALATAPDDIVFSQAAHGDDPGDSEDLPVPEEDPAGAKIGAVCYSTLSDALAAAVSGDTITLLEDAVLSILDAKEDSDLDSLFRAGGTSALLSQVSGLDDFQLVCFLVVR